MTERDETWKPIPGASKYEVSDKGQVRRDGRILAQRKSNAGYMLVNYTDDTPKKRTGTVHKLVLLAHAPAPKKGEESCHGKAGPLVNWYPENLRWGTKPENEADKETPPQLPEYPCKDGCGALVTREDRRCAACSALTGRKLARMLGLGMNLEVAAVRFGLSSDWAYKIAVQHGGYTATKRDARLQQPSLSQRVAITVRDRRRDGWGDAA